jgi:hypothetical protein
MSSEERARGGGMPRRVAADRPAKIRNQPPFGEGMLEIPLVGRFDASNRQRLSASGMTISMGALRKVFPARTIRQTLWWNTSAHFKCSDS